MSDPKTHQTDEPAEMHDTHETPETPKGPSPVVVQRVIAVIALGITFVVLGSVFVPQDTTAHTNDHTNGHQSNGHQPDGEHATPNDLPDVDAHDDASPPTEAWGDVTITQSSSDPHADLPLLGSLEGVCFRTEIYGTDNGPRFTVYELDNPDPVAVLLDSRTLTKYFPDVPQPTIASNGELRLMYVDPAGEYPN